MKVTPVIYGKHPAYGDFLAHGLEHAQFRKFDAWLETILPPLKKGLGDQWEAAWGQAPVLRFWIGPDVVGFPLLGVLYASRDKVGRRYPLMFGLTGIVSPPPTHAAHQEAVYDALHAHMAAFEVPEEGTRGAKTLLNGFDVPDVLGSPFEEGFDGTIWGSRQDGDLARLFQDARAADYDKSQLSRSHWWHAADHVRDAGWLAVNGLPELQAMTWLLTERLRPAAPQKPQQDKPTDDTDASSDTSVEATPTEQEDDHDADKHNLG